MYVGLVGWLVSWMVNQLVRLEYTHIRLSTHTQKNKEGERERETNDVLKKEKVLIFSFFLFYSHYVYVKLL